MSEIDICSQTLCFVGSRRKHTKTASVCRFCVENAKKTYISYPACSAASLSRLLQPLNLLLTSGLFSRFIIPGFFSRSVCISYPACSAASLSRLLQPRNLLLVSGLFSRFIIPASSAVPFASRVRFVQPLHPGFFSRSICSSYPACSAASLFRLLQPLRPPQFCLP